MKTENVKNVNKTVSEEYQIPELVDLNSINETQASINCSSGSSNINSCASGASGPT